MKKTILIICNAVLFAICFISCDTRENVNDKLKEDDVYVCGFEENEDGNWVAKYWKNGSPVTLSDGSTDAEANAIFISGNDIYVAGYESYSHETAKYWKNGHSFDLTDGSFDSEATSIFVVNGDVYVTGTIQHLGMYNYRAVYWKNGIIHYLTDGSEFDSYAQSICISGNDIYITGAIRKDDRKPVYWKNGNVVYLAEHGYANDITVFKNNIYVVGSVGDTVKYWKNGVPYTVSDGQYHKEVNTIFVNEEDIYIGGGEWTGEFNQRPRYWKNGVSMNLLPWQNDISWVNSIFVSGSDVYMVGYVCGKAKFWKNGEMNTIGSSENNINSVANDVLVVTQ